MKRNYQLDDFEPGGRLREIGRIMTSRTRVSVVAKERDNEQHALLLVTVVVDESGVPSKVISVSFFGPDTLPKFAALIAAGAAPEAAQ